MFPFIARSIRTGFQARQAGAAWLRNLIPASMLHDNERPGIKESSIQDPGFLAGSAVLYLLGSHLLQEDIDVRCRNWLAAAWGR